MTPPKSHNDLTAALAERVMGWRVTPDRFLKLDRVWIPRWRFQPTTRLEDAFTLLEHVTPRDFLIHGESTGSVFVQIRIGDSKGEARASSAALALSAAIAIALGLEVSL